MPIINSKIQKAMSILDQLKYRLLDSKTDFGVEAYQNGVEQGFTVYKVGVDKCGVTFCEESNAYLKIYLDSYSSIGLSTQAQYPKYFMDNFSAIKYMVEHLTGMEN